MKIFRYKLGQRYKHIPYSDSEIYAQKILINDPLNSFSILMFYKI